ncbi:MAG: hypothetical protein ACO3SP_01920, partial [Ilumatobacteraceae bacterium]
EELEGEFLVCDRSRSVVHRLSSNDAPWFHDFAAGRTIDVDNDSTLELERAGVLQRISSDSEHNRRTALKIAAASVAAVGLSTLALPSAAAAASIGLGVIPPPPGPTQGLFIRASQTFSGTAPNIVFSNETTFSLRYGTTVAGASSTIQTRYNISGTGITPSSGGPAGTHAEIVIGGWSAVNARVVIRLTVTAPAFGLAVGDEASFSLLWGINSIQESSVTP